LYMLHGRLVKSCRVHWRREALSLFEG